MNTLSTAWSLPPPVATRRDGLPLDCALDVPWLIRATLLAFIFLIPLETLGHESETSSFTISRLAGMVLLASCLIRPRLLVHRPHPVTVWGFVLMSFALIQTVFVDPDLLGYAVGRYVTWLQMLVFFHLAQPLLAAPALRRQAIYAYIAGAALTSALLLSGSGLNAAMMEKGRTALGNLDPNVQAAIVGLAGVWLLALLLQPSLSFARPLTWLAWAILALLISASLLTGSRGGLIALCLGLVATTLLAGGLRHPVLALLFVLVGLAGLGLVVTQNELMMDRIRQSVEAGDTAGRDYIFASSLDLWWHRPVAGWGLGANEGALGGYTNTTLRDMHSIYLYALTAGGAVGAVLLGGLLWTSVRSAIRLPSGLYRQIALGGLIFVLTFGGTVTILFFKFFWVALILASSLSDARLPRMKLA